ncbi:MAG: hypothetical protein JW797_06495 [Bradymonadales bacterium]|nr:hypothetical protein [Bradymonadales bacterium]
MTQPCLKVLLVTMLAAGCGFSTRSVRETPPADPPLLFGLPVSDVPLDQASPAVAEGWALTLQILQDRLSYPAEPVTLSEYRQWMDSVLRPWLLDQSIRLGDLLVAVDPLRAGWPKDRLFAAVVHGASHQAVADQIRSAPVPSEISEDPERNVLFRDSLDDSVTHLAHEAWSAYQQCIVEAASSPPMLRGWGEQCALRARDLPLQAFSPPAPSSARRTMVGLPPVLPPECQGRPLRSQELDAPPPDERVEMVAAVVYFGDRFAGQDRERLLEEVGRHLAGILDLPVLSRQVVQRAERLHAERRLTDQSPVCGQAPPLASILAHDDPNLLLAEVSTRCSRVADVTALTGVPGGAEEEVTILVAEENGSDGGQPDERTAGGRQRHCTLTIRFDRAGTHDQTGAPPLQEAAVRGDPSDLASWLEAIDRLHEPSAREGVYGMLVSASTVFLLVADTDPDPWLRVSPTLRELEEQIRACQPLPGVASYRLAWTISPTGVPGEVEVEPITPPAGDVAEICRCMADILSRSAWPCTPSGQPERVEVQLCVGR